MRQVVANLLSNALKFTPPGGRVVLGIREDASMVRLAVSDTGPGIEEDLKEKIFEPFFTTKTTGEGTGLGLSVSYAIVKEHQGTIKVSSSPGKGALFTLRFPAVVDTLKGENHEQQHDLTTAGE